MEVEAGAGLLAAPFAAGLAVAAAAGAFLPLPPTVVVAAGAIASLDSCLANRAFRRPALLRCRTPFDAARSSPLMASSAIA